MIAIDWGTSSFRAFRLDGSGAVVAVPFDTADIKPVPGGPSRL